MSARKGRSMKTAMTSTSTISKRQRAAAEMMNGDGEPSLLTLTEAAQLLGHVHRTTIMRWVKEGRLHCIRLSRKAILFELGEIDRFIREHRYSG